MDSRIKNLLKEEYTDRELMKAELEAQKAQNMINYADEIFNKPKREGIVSDKHKK